VITGASGNVLTIFSEREAIERARSVGATAAGSSVGANVNALHGSATNVVHAATSFMTTKNCQSCVVRSYCTQSAEQACDGSFVATVADVRVAKAAMLAGDALTVHVTQPKQYVQLVEEQFELSFNHQHKKPFKMVAVSRLMAVSAAAVLACSQAFAPLASSTAR
jgi:hypothetical protein